MAKTKSIEKELASTEVSDNGEAKEPTLEEELESIVKQYNEAIEKRNQFDSLATRCLGAIEVLEKMVKRNEDAKVREE
mgnify:CR=1 FL=1